MLRRRLLRATAATAVLILVGTSTGAAQVQAARRAGRDEKSATEAEARLRSLSRLLMRQSRNLAVLDIEGGEVLVHCGKLPADGTDFGNLESLEPGQVQVITAAATTKLRSDADLHFRDATIPTANVAEGFAGLYGLWLKRAGDGWHLLFNNEADVWGTQRDPGADVAEIALDHENLPESAGEMTVALRKTESGGVLEIRWGHHHWSAPFRLTGVAVDSGG